MIDARKYIITGRVQGVGYRYFACKAAAMHAVSGTVRNAADGSVECIAEGERSALDAFRDELRRGPRMGHVDSVTESPMEPAGRTTFDIRH